MLAYIYVVALHSFAGSLTMAKEATARGGHSLTDEKTKSKALMAEATMVSLRPSLHVISTPCMATCGRVTFLIHTEPAIASYKTESVTSVATKGHQGHLPGLQVPWSSSIAVS
jgi:hypothetical protein